MATIPLAAALPAAAAGLAYLNGRTQFTVDAATIGRYVGDTIRLNKALAQGRANFFYKLEEHALSPKSAGRAFIAVPPAVPKDSTPESLRGLQCQEWTYREAYNVVLQYAAWLKQEHGVGQNDIVALDCTNKPIFIFLWFALWSLGARPAFINTSLRGQGLLHCIRSSTARLLLLDPAIEDALSPEIAQELSQGDGEKSAVTTVIMDDEVERRVAATQGFRADDAQRHVAKPTEMCQLIFTSGTTGLPKPAVVTWKRFYSSCMWISGLLGIKTTDRFYTAMPLYHSSASMLCVGISLAIGNTIIISSHFSPRTFFASVSVTRATIMQYIGEMCRYLVATPPSRWDTQHSLRMAFGNGLRPDIWRSFKERFALDTIAEFYGATESPASSFAVSRNNFGLGAVGRGGPFMHSIARRGLNAIVYHDIETGEPWRDPKTGLCAPSPLNEAGELLAWLDPKDVKDKYGGYWGNEKATSDKVITNVFAKGDAYFRTGDLMRLDGDGRLFFVDRIGDTFRWKGENVSTGEVENVVAAHPAVSEANVYGVQLPAHDGRAGCAAVMFAQYPSPQDLGDLARHVSKGLPKFARPLFLRVVKEMETTGTSKYTKHGLRTQGVDPSQVGDDRLFWLHPTQGMYVEFGKRDWDGIVGGQTKL